MRAGYGREQPSCVFEASGHGQHDAAGERHTRHAGDSLLQDEPVRRAQSHQPVSQPQARTSGFNENAADERLVARFRGVTHGCHRLLPARQGECDTAMEGTGTGRDRPCAGASRTSPPRGDGGTIPSPRVPCRARADRTARTCPPPGRPRPPARRPRPAGSRRPARTVPGRAGNSRSSLPTPSSSLDSTQFSITSRTTSDSPRIPRWPWLRWIPRAMGQPRESAARARKFPARQPQVEVTCNLGAVKTQFLGRQDLRPAFEHRRGNVQSRGEFPAREARCRVAGPRSTRKLISATDSGSRNRSSSSSASTQGAPGSRPRGAARKSTQRRGPGACPAPSPAPRGIRRPSNAEFKVGGQRRRVVIIIEGQPRGRDAAPRKRAAALGPAGWSCRTRPGPSAG